MLLRSSIDVLAAAVLDSPTFEQAEVPAVYKTLTRGMHSCL